MFSEHLNCPGAVVITLSLSSSSSWQAHHAKTQTWLNNSAWHKRAWVLIRDADAWAPPYRDLNSVAGAKIHCG